VVLPYRRTTSPSPSYATCLVSLGWLVRRIDVVASHQKDLTWTRELVRFASLSAEWYPTRSTYGIHLVRECNFAFGE
jgi:hypothetical protein